jgi:hypothetical protein
MLKKCKRHRKKKGENISGENSQIMNKAAISGGAPGASNQHVLPNKRIIGEEPIITGGPRVEIVNGKIVVKESSLVVNQDSTFADGDYEEVVEGTHATATYSSFTKRRPAKQWGIEETRLFYQVGAEYRFS